MTGAVQLLVTVALPYAAIVVFVAGVVWRLRHRYTISSLSSQILESRFAAFGSVPFHLGIILVVLGHLAPLLLPGPWQTLVSNRTALLTVETIGVAAAILTLFGLAVLLVRRLGAPLVRAASSWVDVAILLIVIAQVGLGLGVATMHRWGAVWSARTTTPYLWSIFTLQPAPELIAGLPLLVFVHVALAWVLLALIPFTRLVHMFSLPLAYLTRPPQRVFWAHRRDERAQSRIAPKGVPQSAAR